MLIKSEHPENTPEPIETTLRGMKMEFRLLQPLKALDSIEVTPSGMLIAVKLVQPVNAEDDITFTLLGIDTEDNFVQE
jgi:hypothetical protein